MTTNEFLWPEWGELCLRHKFNPHCLRRCNVLKRNDLIQICHWFRSPFRCNVNRNYFITKHIAGKVILRHLFFHSASNRSVYDKSTKIIRLACFCHVYVLLNLVSNFFFLFFFSRHSKVFDCIWNYFQTPFPTIFRHLLRWK